MILRSAGFSIATAMLVAGSVVADGSQLEGYLAVEAYESDTANLSSAAFAQSCFWSGEASLGRVPGVITTEAGWIEGREVTLVRYRADLVSLNTLIDHALTSGVADKVYLQTSKQRNQVAGDDRLPVGSLDQPYRKARASDQKRQIRNSSFDEIDLSPMQQTKVNAFATVDLQQALTWLTPAQRVRFEASTSVSESASPPDN